MKVAFYTLGCRVNVYESEAMAEKFIREGYEVVEFADVSDVYVNAVIGDGKDAGGYIGGVIGRNKNEFDCYSMTLYRCVFEGQVMTGKDYSGGIFAGCDNGAGNIHINSCAANCTILLKGVLLDGVAAM